MSKKILKEGRAQGLAEARAEGRIEEAKRILKQYAAKRFGEPGAHFEAAIDAVADLEELEQLIDRVVEVPSWEELLGDKVNGAS